MSTIFGEIQAGGIDNKIPEGMYDGLLIGIAHLGTQKQRDFNNEAKPPKDELRFIFEIPEFYNEEHNIIKTVSKKVTLSTGDRSNLFKLLKGLNIVKEAGKEEIERVFASKESVGKILGTPAQITISHWKNAETKKEGHQIDSVGALHPKVEPPVGRSDCFFFSMAEPDLDVFKNNLTPYLRATIMEALNASSLPASFGAVVEQDVAEAAAREAAGSRDEASPSFTPPAAKVEAGDDDIEF